MDYTFPSGPSGSRFNCAAPVNNSPHNTGLTNLPAARAAWIKYDNCSLAAFGCGSESPMGAPVYRYDAANPSTVKFPPALDGHVFAAEFGRRWIKTIDVNSDGSAGQINEFPWRGTQVMDSAFGPDGALYVLDYGTGWGSGDASSALYRIEYNPAGNQAPVARVSANRTSGRRTAGRELLVGRLLGPGGRRADLRVELRRRQHVHGGEPEPHLHRATASTRSRSR